MMVLNLQKLTCLSQRGERIRKGKRIVLLTFRLTTMMRTWRLRSAFLWVLSRWPNASHRNSISLPIVIIKFCISRSYLSNQLWFHLQKNSPKEWLIHTIFNSFPQILFSNIFIWPNFRLTYRKDVRIVQRGLVYPSPGFPHCHLIIFVLSCLSHVHILYFLKTTWNVP